MPEHLPSRCDKGARLDRSCLGPGYGPTVIRLPADCNARRDESTVFRCLSCRSRDAGELSRSPDKSYRVLEPIAWHLTARCAGSQRLRASGERRHELYVHGGRHGCGHWSRSAGALRERRVMSPAGVTGFSLKARWCWLAGQVYRSFRAWGQSKVHGGEGEQDNRAPARELGRDEDDR